MSCKLYDLCRVVAALVIRSLEYTYFSGTKLPKDFGNRGCLDPSLQELVELHGSRRERDHGFAVFQGVGGRLEVHGHQVLDELLELEYLGFRDALDLGEFADGGVGDLRVKRGGE